MANGKINIRNLTLSELTEAIVAAGFPKFRANQVFDWLWKNDASTFSAMKNIGNALVSHLTTHFFIDHLNLETLQKSKDKTIKCGFKTIDGQVIEGVLIPTSTRMTACISSQERAFKKKEQ